MEKEAPKVNIKWLLLAAIAMLLVAAVLFTAMPLISEDVKPIVVFRGSPALIIETPEKISLKSKEDFTVDVSVTDFGDARYPAASMSISFDKSRLEFLGVEEGNVFVYDQETVGKVSQKLPEWGYSTKAANADGMINIMYLDVTGGKCSFARELLAAEDNVVLRLRFRLRGSARKNDVFDLTVEDAVFAASDESKSLAVSNGSLKVKSGKIVVGE